jgi:hypothetical protein
VGVVGAARDPGWYEEEEVAGGANGALAVPFEGEWDGVVLALTLFLPSEAQKSSYVLAAPPPPPPPPSPMLLTERVGDGWFGVDREGEG